MVKLSRSEQVGDFRRGYVAGYLFLTLLSSDLRFAARVAAIQWEAATSPSAAALDRPETILWVFELGSALDRADNAFLRRASRLWSGWRSCRRGCGEVESRVCGVLKESCAHTA
jgi:hypothetical protein